MDKRISLEAAADAIQDGSTLALGGMTLYRRPMAFVKALLQRHRRTSHPIDLTLIAFTCGLESDLLVGAGMLARVRTCYFGLEIFGLAPMFSFAANHGLLTVQEESEASLAFGLRAQMSGIGFMPGRGWLGTDMLKLRPDVRTIIDPYNGEEMVAFPAIRADVAVIHALRADPHGNAVIGENKGIDEELSVTSPFVIVTAESIVPELQKADIVAPFVHAVVEAPLGAAPTSCHPLYPIDGEALLAYSEQVSNPESYAEYLSSLLGA